jgi:APA family basic amino acid/polyamine antiporter
VFARVHPKYGTPWFTIVLFGALATLLLIPGKTDFLGNLYSFGAMLSFTTAHAAVVALRYRRPDVPRPYRVPWNVRFRGGELPLGAVIGGIGTFAAWVSVVVLHVEARTVGLAWMVFGMVGYYVYRRSQGLAPTVCYELPKAAAPEGFRELAYRSAIVPILGSDVSGRSMRAAARLVDPNASVDAIVFLEVPPQLPLEAGLEREEEEAREVLEAARLRAHDDKLKIRTAVVRTRSAGAAIVDEARRRNAEVIYLDFAGATRPGLSATASYVLEKRPCRVVIETIGGGAPAYSSNGGLARVTDRDRARGVPAGSGSR